MSTAPVKSIPQPLGGAEIKKGIAARMTADVPPDVAEALREQIVAGLGKTCSLNPNFAYAKFKANWTLTWWRVGSEIHSHWWVEFSLNDFGRITPGGIGDRRRAPAKDAVTTSGVIEEAPPDRFRRETDQPIPRPTELKQPEPEKSSFSKSMRGQGKRRDV
jgi:hypothetical protein